VIKECNEVLKAEVQSFTTRVAELQSHTSQQSMTTTRTTVGTASQSSILPSPIDRITLECPGCHAEISGPRREERGVTCPHCGLGIPPDLIPEPPTSPVQLTNLLDIALADTQAELGTLEILQPGLR
jgi:hypothetical protein